MPSLKTLLAILGMLATRFLAHGQEMSMPMNSTNAPPMSSDDTTTMDHKPMGMKMHGMYGNYPMPREASGTAWQPDATPMDGLHIMHDDWMFMFHGYADVIYDDQTGQRGDRKFFSPNMLMGMAQHPLGPGTFGVRAMLSLEPVTIGNSAYPELLQTGETADGKNPLIDRQHPHDLFMELAATYSISINENNSAFVYFGYPGEPALGPATFMHRFSGVDIPEAPITHHWMDSTHITFGVATVGYVWKQFKFDGSIFNGREPDQYRWGFDSPRFDSYSGRITYNPSKNWSMQVSYGDIHSPEELTPNINQRRVTASVTYQKHWDEINWGTTLAWGEDFNRPGNSLYALLLESTIVFNDANTFFGRIENVQKDELFPLASPLDGEVFNVGKISAGYIHDFPRWHHVKFGVGGLGSVFILPASLASTYGQTPTAFMVFVRAKL